MEFWFKWGQLQQNHRDREKEKIIPERSIRELFPRDGAMVVGTAKPQMLPRPLSPSYNALATWQIGAYLKTQVIIALPFKTLFMVIIALRIHF